MTEQPPSPATGPETPSPANPVREAIARAIEENPVILFMKGNPDQPACGFSARTVAALQSLGAPFAAVDVLPDPRIRQELSALSSWPTIPQLFVERELIGGCDIVMEMYESGELAEALGIEEHDGSSQLDGAADSGMGGPAVSRAPLTVENRLS